MTYFQARTDLALEAREYVENSNKEVRGVEKMWCGKLLTQSTGFIISILF